jgi:hypothetical protein
MVLVDKHGLTIDQYKQAQWFNGTDVDIYWNESAWGPVSEYVDYMSDDRDLLPAVIFGSCSCLPEACIRDNMFLGKRWIFFGRLIEQIHM